MVRSITEILKEADSATEMESLEKLWNELAKNKKKYPLVQIWFAIEHMQMLVKKQAKRDFEYITSTI